MTTEPPHRPAGIVTRLLAATVDGVAILGLLGGLVICAAALRFLLTPASFSWPAPVWSVATPVVVLVAIGYLATGWATTGRTYDAALLGLRVLSSRHEPVRWPRAVLRAALCVAFPIGVLWAAVSRKRRSLQDILVRTTVVYDWHATAWRS